MALRSSLARLARLPLRALFIALCVLLGATLFGCQNYDTLVAKDQECQKAWGNLQSQLQRRYDLIPNIVATVKGSAKFEKETLEAVTKARAEATSIKVTAEMLEDPAAMQKFNDAQAQLKGSLSRLLAVAEAYPDLKSTQGFHDLTIELEGTENRIQRAREQYNAAVGDYNTELGKIKGQVVNKVTGRPFKPRAYYQADAAATGPAPTVSF
jgi:LemA protein